MNKTRVVNCPRCGEHAAWARENPYRPFCSERCKLIDLGDWAMEKYRVPEQNDNDNPDTDQDV